MMFHVGATYVFFFNRIDEKRKRAMEIDDTNDELPIGNCGFPGYVKLPDFTYQGVWIKS